MKTIILLSFLAFWVISFAGNPGVRISLSEKYINSFLQEQLPVLLPKSLTIPEISKNTTHSNFLANITSVSVTNLDLDFMDTKVSFDEENNKMVLTLTNFNIDLYLDYLFRALYFETSGHITLENNITINLELTSSYDNITQKPILGLTSFNVDYHSFNLLFGGSVFSYLIDIFEGFCDCVVKEQYPTLLQSALNLGFEAVIDEINNKFFIDVLNFTEIGLDLRIPQPLEFQQDHLNFYSNALFFDPFEPFVDPPIPSELFPFNSSHEGIEIALNQGVLNSLLWTLNNQEIFDLSIKGDQIPIELPFKFEIDTKLFQLALPQFYNYYGTNKIVDLIFTTNGSAPILNISENDATIAFQLNESVTFLVRLDENIEDEAFIVNFSLDAIIEKIAVNDNHLILNLAEMNFDNSELIKSKIPDLQLEGLNKMINSMMSLASGMVNIYLKTHPLEIPQIAGIDLQDLEILVRDQNLIMAVKPMIIELHPEILLEVVREIKKVVHKVRV